MKEERNRLGLTQEEFARLSGATRRTQTNYENDSRSPDADYLSAIAKAGADVGYLLTGVRSNKPNIQAKGLEDYPEVGAALVLDVMQFVDTWLYESELKMPPPKKAEMVKLLCKMLVRRDRERGQMSNLEENSARLGEYVDVLKTAST
ncbi:helix-turn-helix domain-containing protein [Candidatus Magnetaquiglobus chichijimensis]|uniref:helix-turn-helix domain-containing protein n=1 Tax=Candidatus Magnetaquiglobus chichijimensis TaxID=3141448 RepID=UPI003B978D9B